ncbi:MAG: hypothetical protein KBG70_09365 [Chitinophagales bacterium]|nr:hypothetical protein [Chitinophagales bacterium]
MTKLPTTILLILFSTLLFGQKKERKSFFLEIGGSGGLGSINYESEFFTKNHTDFTWRAGLSIAPIDKNNGVGIVFPLMINSICGKNAHKLEYGLGQGITITTKGSFFALTTAVLGYRYQPETKSWYYRVSYTPLISYLVDLQIQQWGVLSIGYTFNHNPK